MFITGATRSRSYSLIILRVIKKKHHEVLRDRFIRREVRHMLNNDVPYLPPARLLEPKVEPVEEFHGDYCFMYKEEGAFIQGD